MEEDFFERYLLYPVIYSVLIFVPFGFVKGGLEYHRLRRLEAETYKIADINKDGITSKEELARIYQELGVQFVEDDSRRRGLTKSELEKYLENHEAK